MKTKREITLANWRGHGPLTIPAGTRVGDVIDEPRKFNQPRQRFVEDFSGLFPPGSIQAHDATYYGIRVDDRDCGHEFAPWQVEAGRVITNGRVRFYLSGCRDEGTEAYQYEPVWLDALAHRVCAMLNDTQSTGEV